MYEMTTRRRGSEKETGLAIWIHEVTKIHLINVLVQILEMFEWILHGEWMRWMQEKASEN